MKKATILCGSGRKGNSLYVSQEIVKRLETFDVEVICPYELSMGLCSGCLLCDDSHECYIRDDMDESIIQLVNSDYIILVSPVRWGLLSGDLKVFIDRLNPVAVTEKLADKKCICVAIGQSDKEDGSIETALDSMVYFALSAGMEVIGKYPIYECLKENDAKSKEELSNMFEEIKKKVR